MAAAKRKRLLTTKIRAIRDFIWVKLHEEKVNPGGTIIIPDNAKDKENPREGIVVAVGDGLVEGGIVVPLTVKVGDNIRCPRNAGTIVKINETGEEFFVLRENQVFGAVTFSIE